MLSLAWRHSVRIPPLSSHDILVTALAISFPVIGLDKFLRVTPASLSAQPALQVEHWVADSLMAVPLFAAAVWAGDRIASRAGLGRDRRADALKRALIISLLAALALAPVWLLIDKFDNPVLAQPLVAPHKHDSGDVYWVSGWVIPVLVCACLAPLAFWAGLSLTRRLGARLPRGPEAVTRAAVPILLVAAAAAGAWYLHQAAWHGYASQVYYSAGDPVPARSHAVPAPSARPAASQPVGAAPYAFAYQAAHALQDGLVGQAAGLPAAAITLLHGTRSSRQKPASAENPPQGGNDNE